MDCTVICGLKKSGLNVHSWFSSECVSLVDIAVTSHLCSKANGSYKCGNDWYDDIQVGINENGCSGPTNASDVQTINNQNRPNFSVMVIERSIS